VGSITVPLTSCLTGLNSSILQIQIKTVSCHTADSKPVKQKVNGTVVLPPLVFPGQSFSLSCVTQDGKLISSSVWLQHSFFAIRTLHLCFGKISMEHVFVFLISLLSMCTAEKVKIHKATAVI
jgi:hypothetical protein